jgi:hypothetical protein
MDKHIKISLGWSCKPREYIKNNFMSKQDGYLTCPFDLCITPFDSMYNCLETDFKYFFDDLKTIPGACHHLHPKKDLEEKHNITNYYKMIFNHEGSTHSNLFNVGTNDDLFYIRNDFDEFKKRYLTRIDNFRNYINNYVNITFIIYKWENDKDTYNLDKLNDLLRKKYPNKNIEIVEI